MDKYAHIGEARYHSLPAAEGCPMKDKIDPIKRSRLRVVWWGESPPFDKIPCAYCFPAERAVIENAIPTSGQVVRDVAYDRRIAGIRKRRG